MAVTTTFSALTATVKDTYGNPVPGITVTLAATPATNGASLGGGTLSQTTNTSGVVTFADLTANTIAGTYTVATTAPNVTTPASFTLTNTAGNPGSITATAGTPQSATVNTQSGTLLTALVKDGFNNPVPNATATFTVPAPTLSGVFGMNGIAPAPAFTANTKAGSYTVTAGVGMVMTTAAFALTNNPGAPATITADAAATSQNAQVGQPFAKPLAVTVSDQYGNPVAAGITVTYTAGTAPGGASATLSSGGTAMMNASDQASVMAKANSTAGGYSVTARISGITTPASFALTTTPGPPAHLTASAGMSQHTTVGTAFGSALQATVTDASNNPVSGVTVTFTATAATSGASATLSNGGSATTGANGKASVTATANMHAGGYRVTASAGGVGSPVTFTLTNDPGAPTTLTANAGTTPQSATVNTTFTVPLAVTLTDQDGNPISGVTVTFTAPASGASGRFTGSGNSVTAPTNAQGVATAPSITANSTAGGYAVAASGGGVTNATAFALTNLAGAPSRIAVTAGGGAARYRRHSVRCCPASDGQRCQRQRRAERHRRLHRSDDRHDRYLPRWRIGDRHHEYPGRRHRPDADGRDDGRRVHRHRQRARRRDPGHLRADQRSRRPGERHGDSGVSAKRAGDDDLPGRPHGAGRRSTWQRRAECHRHLHCSGERGERRLHRQRHHGNGADERAGDRHCRRLYGQ